MTSTDLIRPITSVFWELRGYWATGRRVSLSIDADVDRAEGFLTTVSATNAYVKLGDLLVPGDRILAVHRPSRLGDSRHIEGTSWDDQPRRQTPNAEQYELEIGV